MSVARSGSTSLTPILVKIAVNAAKTAYRIAQKNQPPIEDMIWRLVSGLEASRSVAEQVAGLVGHSSSDPLSMSLEWLESEFRKVLGVDLHGSSLQLPRQAWQLDRAYLALKLQDAVTALLCDQITTWSGLYDGLWGAQVGQYSVKSSGGVESQHSGHMSGILGHPETFVIAEQEARLAQPPCNDSVAPFCLKLFDVPQLLLGVENAPIRTRGNAFGLIEAGTQGNDAFRLRVVAQQSTVAVEILYGIKVVAICSQAFNAVCAE
ncbi:hypothetical protein L682_11940 [Aquipseudomonas alcaligenes OT 69]|nr:hypothetical protein L682_11940 [Pseudomonas alcaligenes OT 69]